MGCTSTVVGTTTATADTGPMGRFIPPSLRRPPHSNKRWLMRKVLLLKKGSLRRPPPPPLPPPPLQLLLLLLLLRCKLLLIFIIIRVQLTNYLIIECIIFQAGLHVLSLEGRRSTPTKTCSPRSANVERPSAKCTKPIVPSGNPSLTSAMISELIARVQ